MWLLYHSMLMVSPHASSTLHIYREHSTSFIFSLMTDFICLKSTASFARSCFFFPMWLKRPAVCLLRFLFFSCGENVLPFLTRLYFFLLPFRKSFPTFPVLTDYQHPVRWEEKSVADIKSFFTWIELYRHNILHNTLHEKNKNKICFFPGKS